VGQAVKPQEQRGFKTKPLFDSISPENYLTPVLHAVDIFLNSAKDCLDAFIDHRLENRPRELLEARWEEADRKIAERKALEELDNAKELLAAAQSLGDEDLVNEAKTVLEEAVTNHKTSKAKFGKAAANCRKLEKTRIYGAMSQSLRQEVDGLLADTFHILRSSYHGGDMEGNHCRKLMRLADDAVDAIVALLISVPRIARAPGCSDDEIHRYCGAFKRLFQYFDILSHYCYQPMGTITNDEMDWIRQLVPKMERLWRKISKNMPPKVHAWHHLVEDLDRLRGMKYHQESKIEVAHQTGKKTDLRFRAMAGSIQKKIKCTTKYQANISDPKVLAKQAEIREKAARKYRSNRPAIDSSKRRKSDDIKAIIDLPEIAGDFPNMLELTVIDRLNEN
jgi:hypothetical protein